MDVFTVDPDKSNPESDARYIRDVKRSDKVVSLVDLDRWNRKFQLPIKGLGEASRYLAIPNMDRTIGSDNYVRSLYVFEPDFSYDDVKGLKTSCPKEECGGLKLPGLAATSYAVYNKIPLYGVWVRYGEKSQRINYRYPQTRIIHAGWSKERLTSFSAYRLVSVLDIIEGKLSADEKAAIKGSIIFVGSTAIGAFDHYPSPFTQNLPGVDVHANALDNMLHDDFLKSIHPVFVVSLVLFAIWLPIMLRKKSIVAMTSAVGAFFAAMLLLDYYLFYKLYHFVFATIVVSMSLPFVFVTVHKALMEGREKKWIKSTFGQYLSPKVVEIITRDPSKLSLGGEKRDMTIFFLDIAGFTTMSENMTPEQLTAMLNKYLSGLTDIILKYDGVVDKFIGDCIMAFWNAPLDQKDHRRLACLAAVHCTLELARLNRELTEFPIKPDCRIGLNSGPAVVGNMGSSTRLSYTVLGDTVNLASRLEGANKYFHSRIMVSEATYEGGKDAVEARVLGQIRVVGKAIPVKVYELMGHKGGLEPARAELLGAYNAALEHFSKGAFDKAARGFKEALALDPKDGPSAFYLELAGKYSAGAPKDWDGTFNLTSK
jgi:adenylate cyclase